MKAIVKFFLRAFFGSAYPSVIRRISYIVRKSKGGYFGLNGLDRKLEKYVDYSNGFYVELGANDGIRQSNSLHFELTKGWRGVLVEPSPHNYFACKENRSPDNFIYCNACVSFDYSEKYVDIKYADLMTVSKNLDLDLDDSDAHIERGNKFLTETEDNFEFGALAVTLTKLLDKANAPNVIDFLSLDVEGAELDVLEGIDFSKYQFKYLLIEIRDFERVENFLSQHQYKFLEKLSVHDYLFSRDIKQ